MTSRSGSASSRLERALEAWLTHVESGRSDPSRLFAEHADLRDLLEPMVAGEQAGGPTVRVVGDFELRRELGRGGMGVVYEAWQRSLGRFVALKVLAPALVADATAIARFHREAAAAGRLRHPGIVEVHGVGHDGDVHWFAMTLVEGEPLHRCRERFRAPRAGVTLVAQVLDALQHAHAAGLVHRDVKPANILVRADGAAVLTDFGLARTSGSPTVTVEGGFLGTLDYAAPEQQQGAAVDARADVWSAGVVLAELLTGVHPFARQTTTATLRAILAEEPAGMQELRAHEPDLAAIVGRALEKDRDRRYPSAVAFLADLRSWQHGLAVAARLPSVGERLRRWMRREPWRAAAAMLLVLGVPTLATVGGYLWANAPRIAAAERAERADRREQAITAAWIALDDERFDDGLRALAPWTEDPNDLEVRFAQTALLTWVDPQRATEPLRPFAGTRIHELAAVLLANAGRDLPFRFEDVSADTMLECAALAQLAVEQVKSHHRGDSFYVHAAKWYGRAVALSPQPRAWLLLQWGIAAARADDTRAFADALAAYEHHFPGTRGLALMYASAATTVSVDRGLQVLSDPELGDDPRWHFARGQLLGRAGRLEEAIAEFEHALARKPANAAAWRNLAKLQREAKAFDGSLASARRATEIDPRSADAFGLVGAALSALGRFDEAKAAFERAMEIEPMDWKHPQNLGLTLYELHDDEAAIAAFAKAAVLAPSAPGPQACLARSLRALGRNEEALLALARADALEQTPDGARVSLLGKRATELGLGAAGRAEARRATVLAPNDPAPWWRLAEVELDAKPSDPVAAHAAMQRARELGGELTTYHHLTWGRVEAANGNTAVAIEQLETALRDGRLSRAVREQAEALLATLRAR